MTLFPVPPLSLLILVLVALGISGTNPQADRLTWLLETLPILIGAVVLLLTWRHFPLTSLTTHLIALHSLILMIGGYSTYAEVPLFNHLQEVFNLQRNHYDRVAHFVQGFVPALIARELMLRRSCLNEGKWLFFLTSCFCLAF